MALVNFKKGLLANLPATKTAGTFYITTDERAMYLDVDADTRIRLGDFQEFANVTALTSNPNPSTTALYYVSDINCLAKWNGSEYIQINKDTGMTSVEVTGDGNAITAAVYDAAGRKLTLTKGATYMTAADVDGKISTAVGALGNDAEGNAYANVKAYVDAKTSGIATDTALNELTGRVSTAESEIDALQAAIADGGSVTLAIADAKKAGTDAAAAAKAAQDTADSKVTMAQVEAKDYATKTEAQGYANAKDAAIQAAQAKADSAYTLAGTKATMDEVNTAIANAGHAVKADVDTAIENLDKAYKAADTALETKLQGNIDKKANQTDLDGVAGRVATIESDYLKAADKYNDTKVKEDIAANLALIEELQGEVDTLNGDAETEGSVDYKIAQAVAAIMENPDDTMNSINELVTWINDHAADALELSNQVTANKDDIAALEGLVGTTGVAAQIEAAIAAALKVDGVDKYALAADLTAAITRIVALEADTHTHGNKTILDGITTEKIAAWDGAKAGAEATAAAALSAAKTELEGKISDAQAAAEKKATDLNTAMNTRVEALEAIDHDHANKAELDLIASGDVAKWNAAQANAEATAAGALATAKSELEGKITAAETAAKGHADTEVGKVQTALNTYKNENDAAVALKANAADVYAKTETYTKTEVDAAITAAHTWGEF